MSSENVFPNWTKTCEFWRFVASGGGGVAQIGGEIYLCVYFTYIISFDSHNRTLAMKL